MPPEVATRVADKPAAVPVVFWLKVGKEVNDAADPVGANTSVPITKPRFVLAPDAVVLPVPPLATATVPVTLDAVPVVFWLSVGNVQLAKSPEAGVPRTGVVKVGDVSVLFVSVSVVLRPTNVVVASGNVTTRPEVDTASIKVIALAAELTLLKRMPLSKSAPSLIVTRPVPLG